MTQDIRVCFVGDSFVNGTGDETALGWAGRVCAAAAGRGIALTYYNLGIRRDTSRDVLQRWERECALRLPAACDGRIVVSCGVNDTVIEADRPRLRPEESAACLRELLLRASKYTVLMVGPPPVGDESHNDRIGDLSQRFAAEAQALDVPYIDLFTPLVSDTEYRRELSGNDGAHPRSGGYARMAQIVSASPAWWFPAR